MPWNNSYSTAKYGMPNSARCGDGVLAFAVSHQ